MYASDQEIATFFARDEWRKVRLSLQLWGHFEAVADIDRLVERVRRDDWGDLSTPEPGEQP